MDSVKNDTEPLFNTEKLSELTKYSLHKYKMKENRSDLSGGR
jgi:hypothetical protein